MRKLSFLLLINNLLTRIFEEKIPLVHIFSPNFFESKCSQKKKNPCSQLDQNEKVDIMAEFMLDCRILSFSDVGYGWINLTDSCHLMVSDMRIFCNSKIVFMMNLDWRIFFFNPNNAKVCRLRRLHNPSKFD